MFWQGLDAAVRAGSVPLSARSDHRPEAFAGGDAIDGGLAIFKHTYDLSDEVLCERWSRTPITSSSAARSCSSIGWCWIARPLGRTVDWEFVEWEHGCGLYG